MLVEAHRRPCSLIAVVAPGQRALAPTPSVRFDSTRSAIIRCRIQHWPSGSRAEGIRGPSDPPGWSVRRHGGGTGRCSSPRRPRCVRRPRSWLQPPASRVPCRTTRNSASLVPRAGIRDRASDTRSRSAMSGVRPVYPTACDSTLSRWGAYAGLRARTAVSPSWRPAGPRRRSRQVVCRDPAQGSRSAAQHLCPSLCDSDPLTDVCFQASSFPRLRSTLAISASASDRHAFCAAASRRRVR